MHHRFVTKREAFSLFVSGGVQTLPPLAQDGAAEQWHEVSGGSLGDRRVLVRLSRDDNGALTCTGLLAGLDGEEITSTSLRGVPVAAIVREFGRLLQRKPTGDPLADMDVRAFHRLVGGTLGPAPRRRPGHRQRGGEGPTERDLSRFMRALAQAGGYGKRGAMTRAAKAYGIDRSTAYRWRALADQRGITGTEEGDQR